MIMELGGELDELDTHPTYGKLLADDQYDRLFIVTLPTHDGASVGTLELRYGK